MLLGLAALVLMLGPGEPFLPLVPPLSGVCAGLKQPGHCPLARLDRAFGCLAVGYLPEPSETRFSALGSADGPVAGRTVWLVADAVCALVFVVFVIGSAALTDRPDRRASIGGRGRAMVVLFPHAPGRKRPYAVPAFAKTTRSAAR